MALLIGCLIGFTAGWLVTNIIVYIAFRRFDF